MTNFEQIAIAMGDTATASDAEKFSEYCERNGHPIDVTDTGLVFFIGEDETDQNLWYELLDEWVKNERN